MAKYNSDLLAKIAKKLGIKIKSVYAIVQKRALDNHVDNHVASLLIAQEAGVNYSRYATADDRAEMRGVRNIGSYTPVNVQAGPDGKLKPFNPGRIMQSGKPQKLGKKSKPTRDNSIFVVHGRDNKLTDDMYAFLRALGLNPIEWNQAISRASGGANPIVGQVINDAMKQAQGIMVLLSPDEDAKLKKKFSSTRDAKQDYPGSTASLGQT